MVKIIKNSEYRTFVADIKKRILKSQYEALKGFSVQNLWYMRQFYLEYYRNTNLQPLVGEISWAKKVFVIAVQKELKEASKLLRR